MANARKQAQILKAARIVRDKEIALCDLEEDLLVTIDEAGGVTSLSDDLLEKLMETTGRYRGQTMFSRLYQEQLRRRNPDGEEVN